MRNVAQLVQVGAPDYEVSRGLSVVEARRVLAAVAEEDLQALYVLALYLRLRRAELFGLRWSDVVLEPEPGQLPLREVRQTLERARVGPSAAAGVTVYAHASLGEKYRALTRLDERLAGETLPSDRRQTGTETAGE
jgi:integrase